MDPASKLIIKKNRFHKMANTEVSKMAKFIKRIKFILKITWMILERASSTCTAMVKLKHFSSLIYKTLDDSSKAYIYFISKKTSLLARQQWQPEIIVK